MMTTPIPSSTLSLPQFHEPSQHHAFINLFRHLVSQYETHACIYYQEGNSTSFHCLTYGQVDHISTNLACHWASFLPAAGGHKNHTPVGFLADHSIDYFICFLAILKLRIPFLALSPRNSNMAIAHLLEKSRAGLLLASTKYELKARDACNLVNKHHDEEDETLLVLSHQLFSPLDLETLLKEPLHRDAYDVVNTHFTKDDGTMPVLYTHSSGTTSFPKLIAHTNQRFTLMAQTFAYDFQKMQQRSKFTLGVTDVLLNTFPLFHIAGMEQTFAAMVHGSSCVFLSQPLAQSTDLVRAMEQCPVTYAALPPLMLDDLAMYLKSTANYEPFQRLKYITFAGAPLRQNVGDFLAAHDIRLQSVVGCTELGVCLWNDFNEQRAPWNACRPSGLIAEYCSWEPFDELLEVYHLVIKAGCPKMSPCIANRVNGDFATNDLFMEDPPSSGYWCHLGRIDDTLVMENGEKTNPTPMEHVIRASPVVKHCIVIGQNRPCTGVLVELKDNIAHKDIKEQVHAAVAAANNEAPDHSHILPHMVYILSSDEHLPLNAKGNVVRKETMEQFKDVIENMYDEFMQGTTSTLNVPKSSDTIILPNAQQLESFLCNEIASVLGKEPSLITTNKNRSLFDLGLNSLLVIHLRNIITKSLKVSIPNNFIYEHPSIHALVHALRKRQDDQSTTTITTMEQHYKETQALLDGYLARAKHDFQKCVAIHQQHHGHVVLLTGATGSLGSFMLCDLIESSRVTKIYCSVRATTHAEAINRIRQSFYDRMLDVSLLDHVKVEALPTDFNATYFGWGKETYSRLRQEVTMVQACGWLVDFNQTITHFDKECIQGLYNLLKFAHHPVNPMNVHTISSISATAAMHRFSMPETFPPQDPHVALPIGYAQSKYIVEHLFDYLMREKHFPCIVERVGQLCGDTIQGAAWSKNEQYPLMIMGGGDQLHRMPDLKDTMVDWLPVNYASAAIVDIMLKSSLTPLEDLVGRVFHIVNPNRVSWSHVLKAMHGCGMKFQVVDPKEWIKTLQEHQTNPAYRLLSFYQLFLLQRENDARPTQIWETKHTTRLTKMLAKAPVLDTNLMSRYYRYWKSHDA